MLHPVFKQTDNFIFNPKIIRGEKMIQILEEEEEKRKENVKKQIKVSRWEQSGIVSKIDYLPKEIL